MTLARPPPWLGLNQHEDTDLCGMYTSPAYGKLAVCFPPSDDGDTAYSTYIDTMLAAIRSAKPIGHAHPKPDLLAVMSEHSMIRTYIALFRVSEGTFWGEEHDVVKIGEQWNDMPHTVSDISHDSRGSEVYFGMRLTSLLADIARRLLQRFPSTLLYK